MHAGCRLDNIQGDYVMVAANHGSLVFRNSTISNCSKTNKFKDYNTVFDVYTFHAILSAVGSTATLTVLVRFHHLLCAILLQVCFLWAFGASVAVLCLLFERQSDIGMAFAHKLNIDMGWQCTWSDCVRQ